MLASLSVTTVFPKTLYSKFTMQKKTMTRLIILYLATLFLLLGPFAALTVNGKTAISKTCSDIENDLNKCYSKIEFFTIHYEADSIRHWNNIFGNKLKQYTEEYPETLNYAFKSLNRIGITTSDDSLFRIYSWNSETGGTMRIYNNVYQYKVGNKVFSTLNKDGGVYTKIFSFKTENNSFYFAVSHFTAMSSYVGQSVGIYEIKDGKINSKSKLFKTKTGFQNSLYFANWLKEGNENNDAHEIYFDNATQTLYVPLVTKEEIMTDKFTEYKYNGQYFEQS